MSAPGGRTSLRSSDETRELLTNLQELIQALDRRIPQPGLVCEAQIAHDAAELRELAIRIIDRIEAPLE